MDLLYATFRKQKTINKTFQGSDCLLEGNTLCAVSCRNIVAYTTTTELEDQSGKSWGSHVYVADLNTPWNSCRILSNDVGVTVLAWDQPGQKLLIADSGGTVQIWMFREHILNEWVCIGQASFTGEHILGAAFFHNGKKVSMVAEKRDSILYNEKFSHIRFAQSVRLTGNRAQEGCLVISSTGMVGAVVIPKPFDGSHAHTSSESLGTTRHRIKAVDICYGKNGHFLVAVTSGNVSLPVQCYRVAAVKSSDEEKCTLTCQALPSFFLQASTIKDATPYRNVSLLRFVVREDADALVVVSNGEESCLVEIWELREKPLFIHKLFQKTPAIALSPAGSSSQPQPDSLKTVLWQHQAMYRGSSPATCVATTQTSLTTTTPPPAHIVIALADSTLHCLHRDGLKQVSTLSISQAWRNSADDQPCAKVARWSGPSTPSHLAFTWTGNCLVVVDTKGQLLIYRVPPLLEPSGSMTVNWACTMLEYCMFSGFDWWDVLVCIPRPARILDAVADRLVESYHRQLPQIQQFYHMHYLCIRTSLHRMSLTGQGKAADLSSLLMLNSVATAFKSLLRPSDLSSHDKGPAESLAAVASEPLTDVDKVLFHLEAKEFTVEPSALQSLQQLIQWVADLALSLLARLPDARLNPQGMQSGSGLVGGQGGKPQQGYELLRDYKALNLLRELLVLVRIWGLLRQSCLPNFVRSSESLDVLALLFRLLSRLAQSSDPDDALIDECCALPSQVMIPLMNPPTVYVGVASPLLSYQALPLQLEFGTEPEFLRYVTPEFGSGANSDGSNVLGSGQVVDVVRHIYLGKKPSAVKQCTRCGGVAQVHNSLRTAAIRAWDQRWARGCLCGGLWELEKFS
ncbi:mediator of RNA polymerase II transcription subunit 16 [Ischnura elegans]|uniref:mediator of RNA polymerase II transcription subunit 16 n=1 Tax=Ischnura elegans TaxID=197161 RepID=UPI001ED87D4B|nr:mediator of RNA polymerase II transcription subunit 16 [Ischnura elegans]